MRVKFSHNMYVLSVSAVSDETYKVGIGIMNTLKVSTALGLRLDHPPLIKIRRILKFNALSVAPSTILHTPISNRVDLLIQNFPCVPALLVRWVSYVYALWRRELMRFSVL